MLLNSSLQSFFDPYYQFLGAAAYSFLKVFTGNITPSRVDEVVSVKKIVDMYLPAEQVDYSAFYALIMLTILLIPLVSMAAYTIGKTKGLIALYVLLCLPGLLNLVGYYPDIQFLSKSFNFIETGTHGSEFGVIPPLLTASVIGWAGVILLYDNLKLSERFRQYYDHLWFPTALVAAFFFVADNQAKQTASNLNEVERDVQQSSRYLLGQVRKYQYYCKTNGIINSKSCQWSNYVQWQLTNTSEYTAPLFIQLAPDTSAEYYSKTNRNISNQDFIDIRTEISTYNQTQCPVKKLSDNIKQMAPLSNICEAPPIKFCREFPDGPEGIVDKYIITQPVVLASECIIPTLVAAKPKLTQLYREFENNERAKNHRWLYFLVIAVAVGGKVANSSTKLAEFDTRTPENRRIITRAIVKYFARTFRLLRFILKIVLKVLALTYKLTTNKLANIKHEKDFSTTNNG